MYLTGILYAKSCTGSKIRMCIYDKGQVNQARQPKINNDIIYLILVICDIDSMVNLGKINKTIYSMYNNKRVWLDKFEQDNLFLYNDNISPSLGYQWLEKYKRTTKSILKYEELSVYTFKNKQYDIIFRIRKNDDISWLPKSFLEEIIEDKMDIDIHDITLSIFITWPSKSTFLTYKCIEFMCICVYTQDDGDVNQLIKTAIYYLYNPINDNITIDTI